MAQGGGFFKGEKKKQKKGKDKGVTYTPTSAPTYSMPEVISKKKRE